MAITVSIPDDEALVTRELADLRRSLRELGPSVAASFAPLVANLQQTIETRLATDYYTRTQTEAKVAAPGDIAPGKVTASGDIKTTADVFVPNALPATASYTIAYLDGTSGRLSKGASSERYKERIEALDPATLSEIFPGVYRFKMRSQGEDAPSDGAWRFGWIAERLAESAALRPFVVYDADGQPDSIDFIGLLIMQTASLHARTLATDTRLAAVERRLTATTTLSRSA